jgi:DNA-binding IclR family transcriptional regulator
MEEVLPRELVRLTDSTITDRNVLRAQVAEVRRTGLSYDMEEYTEGICACGTWVRSVMGDVVSIAAVVTREHWDERTDEIIAAVVHARDAARAALGGSV